MDGKRGESEMFAADYSEIEATFGHSPTFFWFVTSCGLFSALIPTLANLLMFLFSRDTEKEVNLRKQVSELKSELGGISMVDEFAKYAKIQRKINKMNDELKNQNNIRTTYRVKLKLASYFALYLISGLTWIYLMWHYRYRPLFNISGNLLYPIGPLMAFPTGVQGGVGITPWLAITTFVCRRVVKAVLK